MSTLTDFQNYIQKETDLKLEEGLIELLFREFFSNLNSPLHPKLIVLGGAPGAGKTTYRKKFLNLPNFHVHDMDEVLIRLPGYQEDCKQHGIKAAFEKWWPIAQKISNAMVRFAFRHQYNVIYDRTCGTEESFLDLKHIHDAKQYHITIYGFLISEETALTRVKEREKNENRTVTPEITTEYSRRFSALWPFYINIANEAYLLNNNTGFECSRVFERIDKAERIFNLDHYKQFLLPGKMLDFNEKFPRLRAISYKCRYFTYLDTPSHTCLIEPTSNHIDYEKKLIKAKL